MLDFYKVGGSLRYGHPTYITRVADCDIYDALKQKEFCYVLNSRQMGKSSLKVRTMKTLAKEGFKCVAIDLGILGRFTTAEQWYGGLLAELWRRLRLTSGIDDDLEWWRSHLELPPVQRFSRFIEDVLLVNCTADIIIFLDEVDNIINLDFRDEFLILIRNCYEKRVESKQYQRLTFCLLGVATPSNLRIDKQLSPFNIGKAIQLTGFNFIEAQPLISGLNSKFLQPEVILQEILHWTKGQPFLTQKLCYLIVKYSKPKQVNIPKIIQHYLVDNWEIQDEPEHLKTIRDRLLYNQQNKARLLTLYHSILNQQEIIIDGSDEQVELRLSGLVTRQQSQLKVSNLIYERVFNQQWVAKQLAAISPYQNAIAAWLQSQRQDTSRLLRGEALVEGQVWARKHSITITEKDFLQKSEFLAIKEQKQAELARKAEFMTKQLAQEKQLVRWQRLFILFSLAMITGFYLKSRQANLSNISALVQSSTALSASNQKLDGLIAAIKAKQKLNKSLGVNQNLTQQVDTALQQVVYEIKEKNRLLGHSDRVYDIAVSTDGKLMATAATDNTVRLWKKNTTGWQLHKVLKGHDGWVVDVAISPNAKTIASASRDRTVKLWNQNGTLIDTLQHPQALSSVAIGDNQIVTGSENGKINIWYKGKLIQTLSGHTAAVEAVIFTLGDKIISASEDKTLKIWQAGKLIKTLTGHTEGVRAVAVTADGRKIISASRDKTLKIWDSDGTQIATLRGHLAPVYGVAVNPINNKIVSASADKTLKIWDSNGTEMTTLRGHTSRVWDVAYTPDGNIASASWDKTVRLWQPENNPIKTLSGHQDVAIALDYNGRIIASASDDKTVKLWNPEGTLLKTFRQHTAEVYDVVIHAQTIASVGADKTLRIWQADNDTVKTIKAHNSAIWAVDISPDGQKIVTAGDDNLIKIWDIKGNLLHTLKGHRQKVWDVAISPDNKYLVSASEDKTVKVWDLEGELLQTLQGHQDAVRTAITNGKQIISGSEDRSIKIWDLSGTIVTTLEKHQTAVKGISLSPNQQDLASVDDDGKIILWQPNNQTWEYIKTIQGHDNSIWSVAFSPDSQTLATAGEDAKIILWNLNNILQLSPLQYGCNWIEDYLANSSEVELQDRNLCH
ncbi:MAG TPA: AAA-like domain-containing protein [Coleofasciculaceae cyanobacterium]|jgi:WD40 repeat protein